MNKSELKPALVFEQFAKINEIPRPSKHEENMIEFLKSFGEAHQLETLVDETGNVLIRKAATPGYEHAETIILQSHMDMVCDKLVDVDFDFHKDALPSAQILLRHMVPRSHSLPARLQVRHLML